MEDVFGFGKITLESLPKLIEIVDGIAPTDKEKFANLFLVKNYLEKLFALFDKCEQSEMMKELETLFVLFQKLSELSFFFNF